MIVVMIIVGIAIATTSGWDASLALPKSISFSCRAPGEFRCMCMYTCVYIYIYTYIDIYV